MPTKCELGFFFQQLFIYFLSPKFSNCNYSCILQGYKETRRWNSLCCVRSAVRSCWVSWILWAKRCKPFARIRWRLVFEIFLFYVQWRIEVSGPADRPGVCFTLTTGPIITKISIILLTVWWLWKITFTENGLFLSSAYRTLPKCCAVQICTLIVIYNNLLLIVIYYLHTWNFKFTLKNCFLPVNLANNWVIFHYLLNFDINYMVSVFWFCNIHLFLTRGVRIIIYSSIHWTYTFQNYFNHQIIIFRSKTRAFYLFSYDVFRLN